jgi:ABC-type sugar transport system ATPase subunit
METIPSRIKVEGAGKHYGGVVALSDVNIELRAGEIAALVGDNGAGKSTLVKMLSGAHRPDEGRILVDGKEVSFHSPMAAREVGIETVYQSLAMVDQLDVVTNMFLGREKTRSGPLKVLDRRRMAAEGREILERTGVNIRNMKQSVSGLSGGQRQGIAIARAAGWEAKVILMDEPTAALGVQETARVEGIIAGLRRSGFAVLIVSHNLRQVFDLADRVWVLRRGRMVGNLKTDCCTPEDVVRLITGADQAGAAEYA